MSGFRALIDPGFRALLDKEWRDMRALSVASLVLVLLGTLAIRVFFLPENHTYSADALGEAAAKWFVPGMLAVYVAVIASDLVAADAGSGRIRALALLPVPLRRVWTAKVVALLLAAIVFGVFAATCQLVLLVPVGRPGTALAFLDALPQAAPQFGAALGFTCVVLFFSTLLERGFAVGLAALVTVAGMVGVVILVGQEYRDAVSASVRPWQVATAVGGIALLFAAASAWTFTRGPIHASGLLRRAALGLGVVLAVLVPAGLASAKVLHDYVYFEPGEPGLRLGLVSVSPDGRHLVVFAGRQQTRAQHHTWIIDTETGALAVCETLGLTPDSAAHWSDDGLFRAWSSASGLGHWIDPATGDVVRTRSFDQVLATVDAALQPWGRGWARVSGRTVGWPARELSAEMPAGTRADVSPRPGFWLEEGRDAVALHDMEAGTRRVLLAAPDVRRSAHFSPMGDYVSIWTPDGRRVADGRTGARLLGPLRDTSVRWPGGGSPDRYVLLYGHTATRVRDLVTGTELELRPDPNRHGYPPESVRVLPDGRIALVRQGAGTIVLLDAEGRVRRRLYAPRED